MSDEFYIGFPEPLTRIELSNKILFLDKNGNWHEIAEKYDEAVVKHRLEQLKKEEQELLRLMAETDLRVKPDYLTIEFSLEES